MERECCQFLLIQAVGREVAALAVEDETVGPVPVLDDVQSGVDLPSELCWLHGTSVQKTHRLHQPDFPFLSLSSGE